ncbi:MAG: DUF938 domain-containing protein [Pseudomonadota bacterium]
MTASSANWLRFSPSAAQNAQAIFEAMLPRLDHGSTVFEIGSGTGQHAVHASHARPDLHWQPSEHPAVLPALQANLAQHGTASIAAPIACDVEAPPAIATAHDTVYTANTLHILSQSQVAALFTLAARLLTPTGALYTYGPFHFPDRTPVQSNLHFDAQLRAADPSQGVRSLDWLTATAESAQLGLHSTIEMPSNNHILVWQRMPWVSTEVWRL